MNGTKPVFLTCTEIRKRLRGHFLTQHEVPTEYAVSFPLPTLRWGNPGYALFASPALRISGRPKEQGAPDRWWCISAQNGRLLSYALSLAIPFSPETWPPIVLPPLGGTVAELRAAIGKLETILDNHAPAFFLGEACDSSSRQELSQAIAAVLPHELQPQYRALVPDFWAWLKAP
jgi:hypothetical protein